MKLTSLLAACWLCGGCVIAVTVKQASLDGHNTIRRQEAKTENASNIYKLVWDTDLANGAQAWADKCNFGYQNIQGQGENIFYTTSNRHTDDYYIQRALHSWMSEKSDNDDGSFDCCYHGHYSCCHYTQVVAARTRTVGCAVAHCNTLQHNGHTISNDGAYVVCDYKPLGNLAVNGNHASYATGTPCSHCEHGDTCDDALCVDSS